MYEILTGQVSIITLLVDKSRNYDVTNISYTTISSELVENKKERQKELSL